MEIMLTSVFVALLLAVGLSLLLLFPVLTSHGGEQKQVSKSTAGNAAVKTRSDDKRSFTAQEVAKHNSDKSLWMIVKNKVYDVTEYIVEHPGGDSIFNNAGGENTKGFHGPQHPAWAHERLNDFYIGDLKA